MPQSFPHLPQIPLPHRHHPVPTRTPETHRSTSRAWSLRSFPSSTRMGLMPRVPVRNAGIRTPPDAKLTSAPHAAASYPPTPRPTKARGICSSHYPPAGPLCWQDWDLLPQRRHLPLGMTAPFYFLPLFSTAVPTAKNQGGGN